MKDSIDSVPLEIQKLFYNAIERRDHQLMSSVSSRSGLGAGVLQKRMLNLAIDNLELERVSDILDFVQKSSLFNVLNYQAIVRFFNITSSPDDLDLVQASYRYDAKSDYKDRRMSLIKEKNPLLYAIRCVLEDPQISNLGAKKLNFTKFLFENTFVFDQLKITDNLELMRYLLHSERSPKNYQYFVDVKKISNHFLQHVSHNSKIANYFCYHPEMRGKLDLKLDAKYLAVLLGNSSQENIEIILKASVDPASNIYGPWDRKNIKQHEANILEKSCRNKNFDAFLFALNSDLMPAKLTPVSKNNELFASLFAFDDMERLKYLVSNFNVRLEKRKFFKTLKFWNTNSLENFMHRNEHWESVKKIKLYMDEVVGIEREKKEIKKFFNKTSQSELLVLPPKKSYKI